MRHAIMGLFRHLNAPLFEQSVFLKRLKSRLTVPFLLVSGIALITLAVWYGLDGAPLSQTIWRVALGAVVIDIGVFIWVKKTRWSTRPWTLIFYLIPLVFVISLFVAMMIRMVSLIVHGR
jgi:hypothetical protein